MPFKSSTKITFPGNYISETSAILLAKLLPDDQTKVSIFTETTPFHPLDYSWPDQPSDRGTIKIGDKITPIIKCLIAAYNPQTTKLLLDQEIKIKKIKRSDTNWFFLVAHIVESANLANIALDNLIRKPAQLDVDANYRLALSRSHTASHFTALALNKAAACYFRKNPERFDSLGNPNLDSETIISSVITEENSIDQYHCGKSLRKKGFDEISFFTDENFKRIETEINNQLAEWFSIPDKLIISVTPKIAYLHEKREWSCIFPDGKKAVIPCGGTHILQIKDNTKILASLQKTHNVDFQIISQLV